jgi:DNA-binding MarR family transcriptional regulator
MDKEMQNKEYLGKILSMLKNMENIVVVDKKKKFNNSDLRLITEVLVGRYEGKKYISTELAGKLNVTRSAISQIVNKLEAQGIVKRTPVENDKKTAWVEIADGVLETYEQELSQAAEFAGKIVKKFGAAKLDRLVSLANEFADVVDMIRTK